jgi:signal transduction histidine kinase
MWLMIEMILASAAALATIIVGVTVWLGERRNYLRLPFLYLTVVVALWIVSNLLFQVALEEARFAVALISYTTALLVAVQTLYFVVRLVRDKLDQRMRLVLLFGYASAVLAAVPGVVGVGIEKASIVTQPIGIVIYGILVLGYLLASCAVLFKSYRHANRILKRQISLILLGVVASSVIGVLFNLILPMMGNYSLVQLGPSGAVFFVAAVAYAIARYSLFDVRLTILRGIAYLATFSTLAALYLILAAFIMDFIYGRQAPPGQIAFNITVALLMALLLQPLQRFFDRLTARIFYRDHYDTDAFFKNINRALSSSTDLRKILEQTAEAVATTLKAEQAFLFVYTDDTHHIAAGTEGYSRIAPADTRVLDEHIATSPNKSEVIRVDDMSLEPRLKRLLISYNVEVIVPIIREKQVMGYLCLGEKRSGAYSRRDLRLLQTIVDELIIAIQKAIAVQQVKELNTSLEQRIDAATKELRASNAQLQRLDEVKDEFISMASHQLRTPLTSIKGYVSMLMEGDVGEVTAEQKHLLREAFMSSERMVRLISDFLNVSRLQTGKFIIDKHPVDLAQLVQNELDGLETSATGRGMKFSYKRPKNIPLLMLDENKLQQVVMNFCDNALYYSKESSTIKVTLKKSKEAIEFTVVDTGIGVPKAQQAQLFSKFFRATNARQQRPDGTGVGLFLAKKVIDAHGGEMIFSSRENKGSTFGFSLPLERVLAGGDAD